MKRLTVNVLLIVVGLILGSAITLPAQRLDGGVRLNGGLNGALQEGSATAPSLSFANFRTSGFFDVNGTPHVTVGGADSYIFGASTFQTNTGIITNGTVQIPSGALYLFSSDTGLSRTAAGVVAVGNGTANDTSGTVKAAAFQTMTALVSLGGGSAPTLGTIGGSGPATAAQNSWVRMVDSTGAAFWVPVWK